MLPTTRSLQVFEAASRLESFSAAARELNLTQGAISHQVRELESLLDCVLFDRVGRRVALNDDGRAFLPFAREALQSMRLGITAVGRAAAASTLTVSVSPNFASKWLVPRLGDFLTQHPEIDLRISASMRHIDFSVDDVDVAIRHGTGDWPDLEVTRLADETIFPVASGMLPGVESIATPDDLYSFPLLHHDDHGPWIQWLEAVGANPSGVSKRKAGRQVTVLDGPIFDQAAYAIDAAVAGQGIALARSQLVTLDLAEGRLIAPLTEYTVAPFSYWIVYPPATAKRTLIERFVGWLVEVADVTPHNVASGK